MLKTLVTGFFSLGVSQHKMHKITNLQDINESKNTLVTQSCELLDA